MCLFSLNTTLGAETLQSNITDMHRKVPGPASTLHQTQMKQWASSTADNDTHPPKVHNKKYLHLPFGTNLPDAYVPAHVLPLDSPLRFVGKIRSLLM